MSRLGFGELDSVLMENIAQLEAKFALTSKRLEYKRRRLSGSQTAEFAALEKKVETLQQRLTWLRENRDDLVAVIRKRSASAEAAAPLSAAARAAGTPRADARTSPRQDDVDPVQAQAFVRRWLARRRLDELIDKRKQAINALLTAEKNFVDVLSKGIRVFKVPLDFSANKASAPATKSQVSQLFGNIEAILKTTMDLCNILEFACEQTPLLVADAFASFDSIMAEYSTYSIHYPEAVLLLRDISKTPVFAAFIDQRKAQSPLTLEQLLVLPMQRIQKYILLLAEIAVQTTRVHPDHRGINGALALVRNTTQSLADSLRRQQRAQRATSKLDDVQLLFGDALQHLPQLVPLSGNGREVVTEAHVMLRLAPLPAPHINCLAFMLSDCVLFGAISQVNSSTGMKVQLSLASVVWHADITSINELEGNTMSIGTPTAMVSLTTKTPTEKRDWLDHLLGIHRRLKGAASAASAAVVK